MKNLFKITLVSAILALVAFGCKKPVQPDQATTNDVRTAELAQSDVFTFSQQADDGKAFSDDSCFTRETVENNDGSFTTTFTFNSNCTFSDGVVRSGQIIINWTPGWRLDSTKHATVTFNNFTRDSVVVSGTVTLQYTGGSYTANNPPVFSMTEEDMTIKFADGKTASWSGTRTVEWSEGFDTRFDRSDDVKKVNFHREGVNRNGEKYTANGTDLLIKNSCGTTRKSRVVSGTIVITKGDQTTTVDFGNGDCDDTFTITQNGVTITVNG